MVLCVYDCIVWMWCEYFGRILMWLWAVFECITRGSAKYFGRILMWLWADIWVYYVGSASCEAFGLGAARFNDFYARLRLFDA